MKRTISIMLAVLFTFTAFGITTLFGGVFTVGAEFLDYFNYVAIPGFGAFSESALKQVLQPSTNTFEGFSTDFAPAGEYEGKIAKFTVATLDEWGGTGVRTFNRDWNYSEDVDAGNANWAANGPIDGTTIFGDSGLTFEDATGFMFWAGIDGANYNDEVKVTLYQIPCKGPYYNAGEYAERPVGFVYECRSKRADADGYIYLDFKTDFEQVDWWSRDDEGINRSGQGVFPVPASKLPLIGGMQIRFARGAEVGSSLYVGDFRICYDTRIHTDELDEQLTVFDSLDPEAYTEASYTAASEVYLAAYEVFLDPPDQKSVNNAARNLKLAIADLKPLFHAENKDIQLEGFDAWSDEDLEQMVTGLDTPIIDTDVVVGDCAQSIMIMANAVNGEPTYGWSWFTSADGQYEEAVAIGNPFALKDGSAPLSEANGFRFWLKWDESFTEIPDSVRIGVGSSADGVYFETEEGIINLPETQGYVGVPWSTLYDVNGEEDIYDYIDNLDYISIFLNGAVGIYYICDLHAFNWNVSSADFTELNAKIAETYAYMDTLNEVEWYYLSWDRVFEALAAAEDLIGQYAVTQEDADQAFANIESMVNKLKPVADMATRPTMNKLEALFAAAKSYWRGNVTPASYRPLIDLIREADQLIYDGPTEAEGQEMITKLDDAINALVPIKAGETVTSIYSFENWTNRDLNKSNGDRTEGVVYSLAAAADVPGIPEGYAKALKMVATEDMSADNSDEHGVMQFKTMSRDTGTIVPVKIGNNGENTTMGNLTGTDGICLWIGVNDVNLVQDCTLRFAVSNCHVDPLFERAARDIPLPSTGSGWLYIPWEYFEFYDDWTGGEEIRLHEIFFYIIRFNGIVKQGLEVYVTGVHAYKNTANGEWNTPTVNIEEGQTIDISEQSFRPDWSEGTATLDGANFIYGNDIITNGEHVFEVRNGNKIKTVNFTVVGGEIYTVPVVEGVENGGKYTSATASWDVGTATLNGEPVDGGFVEITTPGRYTLVVTNGDKEVTVKFEITEEPEGIRGDLDGDGKITVSDALAALRVAAKMAEETAEIVALGDADADGKITVSDALAILRVAAKMADSI